MRERRRHLIWWKEASHPSQTKESRRYVLFPVSSDENYTVQNFIQQQSGEEKERAQGKCLEIQNFRSPEISAVLRTLSSHGH